MLFKGYCDLYKVNIKAVFCALMGSVSNRDRCKKYAALGIETLRKETVSVSYL